MVLRVNLNVDDFDVDATSTFNLEILVVRKRGAEVTRYNTPLLFDRKVNLGTIEILDNVVFPMRH